MVAVLAAGLLVGDLVPGIAVEETERQQEQGGDKAQAGATQQDMHSRQQPISEGGAGGWAERPLPFYWPRSAAMPSSASMRASAIDSASTFPASGPDVGTVTSRCVSASISSSRVNE